jgi:hypothetical protein
MNFETRKYRLTGITEMLGSQSANPKIHSDFIASKAPTPEQGAEETAMLPKEEELMDNKATVFLRNPADGGLCVRCHAIVGFFKGTVNTLSAQNGIKQAAGKVGNYVFVSPINIPIVRQETGEIVTEPDGLNERPLRGETLQGPRVALASSEFVKDWQIEFEVELIENAGTAKSKPVTFEALEEALDYGRLKGLGQWRNGAYGRFTWERIG